MVKKPSALPRSFLSLRRLLRRSISGRHYRRTMSSATGIKAAPAQDKLKDRTVLVDVEGWLLRLPLSTFPYFMIIAVEAGSFLRGLLLLPLSCRLTSQHLHCCCSSKSFFSWGWGGANAMQRCGWAT